MKSFFMSIYKIPFIIPFHPLLLMQSFTTLHQKQNRNVKRHSDLYMAWPTGLEPATSRVTGEVSNQLSYGRIMLMAGIKSIILDFRFRTQARAICLCASPVCQRQESVTGFVSQTSGPPASLSPMARHVPAFDPHASKAVCSLASTLCRREESNLRPLALMSPTV